jgi:hypothetical protein
VDVLFHGKILHNSVSRCLNLANAERQALIGIL